LRFTNTLVLLAAMNKAQIKDIVKRSVSIAIEQCGTQAALAEKAGITQGAVGKYLRGEAIPRGETANALSEAVGGALEPFDFAPHIFKKNNHTQALPSNELLPGAGVSQ
jgi:transcriptional regulator with XRE-family HTH domain